MHVEITMDKTTKKHWLNIEPSELLQIFGRKNYDNDFLW